MKPLLLATQSRYKKALFEKLGLAFTTASPPFEEDERENETPEETARRLAYGKAKSLVKQYPNHIIIGADQVLALGSQIFHKPGNVEKAVMQLLELSGKSHQLHTAYTILDHAKNKQVTKVVTSHVSLLPDLNPDYLRDYVRKDETWDCVGSYKLEGSGVLLMERLETPDPNAVIGLPIMQLAKDLAEFGYLRERFM